MKMGGNHIDKLEAGWANFDGQVSFISQLSSTLDTWPIVPFQIAGASMDSESLIAVSDAAGAGSVAVSVITVASSVVVDPTGVIASVGETSVEVADSDAGSVPVAAGAVSVTDSTPPISVSLASLPSLPHDPSEFLWETLLFSRDTVLLTLELALRHSPTNQQERLDD